LVAHWKVTLAAGGQGASGTGTEDAVILNGDHAGLGGDHVYGPWIHYILNVYAVGIFEQCGQATKTVVPGDDGAKSTQLMKHHTCGKANIAVDGRRGNGHSVAMGHGLDDIEKVMRSTPSMTQAVGQIQQAHSLS
jgi:hypothetical protein